MIIETNGLTRRFGSLTAVNDMTLSVAEGELFGLVGSDGAGKTTILRMLAGVLDGTSGEARVLGRSHRNLAQVQDEIGYMSQRFGLYPDLTVAENIRFYADLFGVGAAERVSRTERLLGFSGLAPFADRQAGRLSGGMKQKLGLCCALIHTPKLLLLDEPTNGVDPVSRRDFWRILDELRREGVTIVVATAYLDEAERCDRIALVHQGRLLACDTMAGLGKLAALGDGEPTLEEIFVALLGEPEPSSPPHHVTDGGRTGDGSVTMENLSRRFGDFIAVDNITLTVPAGQIFGFLGPNGAGKSTTIRMLCGILPPTSGNGTVAGFDLATEPERIKERIGYMSQRFSLYEDLTVEENIAFYAGVYRLPAERRKERTEWTIRMAGLEERRTSRANELATGWRQRLALGCAILHEPPIVFLDEPTSGVDPLSRRRFWDLIRDLARGGTTIFVTTHYMDEAEYCDRLALIYRGRLIAIGSPAELKKDRRAEGRLPSLEEVFIDLIEEHDRS